MSADQLEARFEQGRRNFSSHGRHRFQGSAGAQVFDVIRDEVELICDGNKLAIHVEIG